MAARCARMGSPGRGANRRGPTHHEHLARPNRKDPPKGCSHQVGVNHFESVAKPEPLTALCDMGMRRQLVETFSPSRVNQQYTTQQLNNSRLTCWLTAPKTRNHRSSAELPFTCGRNEDDHARLEHRSTDTERARRRRPGLRSLRNCLRSRLA